MLLIGCSQWLVHIWHLTRSFNVSSLILVNRVNSLMSEHVNTWILPHCSFAFEACNAVEIALSNCLIWERNGGGRRYGVFGVTVYIVHIKRYIHPFVWCMRVGLGWVGLATFWKIAEVARLFQKVERNLNFIIFFPDVKCVLLEISHFCVIRMMRKKNSGTIN